jgi:hypothetical protein
MNDEWGLSWSIFQSRAGRKWFGIAGVSSVLLGYVPQGCAELTGFDLLRERLSRADECRKIEFIEGYLWRENTTTTNVQGYPQVNQYQKRYSATYQTNGFVLLQKPDTVLLEKQNTKVDQFEDSGGFGDLGWVRRDSAFVRVVNLSLATTNAFVKTTAQEARQGRLKTECAAFYGLPPMDVGSMRWSGTNLAARTLSGEALEAEFSVAPTNGCVTGAAYRICSASGVIRESGKVTYRYSGTTGTTLPDVVQKRIAPSSDGLRASQESFDVKIVSYATVPAGQDTKLFLPFDQTHYLISNGAPLTRVGDRFVDLGVAKRASPLTVSDLVPQPRVESPKPSGLNSIFLVLGLSIPGVLIAAAVLRRNRRSLG